MGKCKIKLEFIEDSKKRSGVFFNRRAGLLKKAVELSTPCGTDVAILVTDLKGHFHCFWSTPELDFVVSERKLKEKLLKADKRLFRYSKEDYPFKKVHQMRGRGSMAVDGLTNSEKIESLVESTSELLLMKRATISHIETQNELKEPSITQIESDSFPRLKNQKKDLKWSNLYQRPSKRLKLSPKEAKSSGSPIKLNKKITPEIPPKMKNLDEKVNSKPRLWFQHENPLIYLFDDYHKINLKNVIFRLESKTHKYHHFFRAQRVGFIAKLKQFHKASNAYSNLECDRYMVDMLIYRLIVSLYFSELECPISRRLREIPLAQFNSFIELIAFKKSKSARIFIEKFRRFLNVILSVISMKISAGRYFSFKRHLKSFTEPLKTKAFYKVLLQKYSMMKVANLIKTHHKHYGIDESVLQETKISSESQVSTPKKFRFSISDVTITDPAMIALMPRIPEVMGYMTLFEDLIYRALNEVRFLAEAVVFEKECMRALGKELFYKIDESEDAVIGLSIEDSGKLEIGGGLVDIGGECLIDLRSRMAGSIGLGSTAKFSWEGL